LELIEVDGFSRPSAQSCATQVSETLSRTPQDTSTENRSDKPNSTPPNRSVCSAARNNERRRSITRCTVEERDVVSNTRPCFADGRNCTCSARRRSSEPSRGQSSSCSSRQLTCRLRDFFERNHAHSSPHRVPKLLRRNRETAHSRALALLASRQQASNATVPFQTHGTGHCSPRLLSLACCQHKRLAYWPRTPSTVRVVRL